MKIAELSSRSGTTVPSIKFYLREGLLPAGTATGRNQADYSETHLRRLRLIRALMDIGGLSVAEARDVITAVETPDLPSHHLLGAVSGRLTRTGRRDAASPQWQRARAEILAVIRRHGWYVPDSDAGIDAAADAAAAMIEVGHADLLACLDTYASAAAQIAEKEVAVVVDSMEPERMVEGVVVGTILGEALFNSMRRLAQQDASARRLLPADSLAALDPGSTGPA